MEILYERQTNYTEAAHMPCARYTNTNKFYTHAHHTQAPVYLKDSFIVSYNESIFICTFISFE